MRQSPELAITSLISNKREWNNCFIKFLKLQKFGSTKYERTEERKSERNKKKKLDEDVMLSNILRSDRLRLIAKKKTFLAFSRTSKRRN